MVGAAFWSRSRIAVYGSASWGCRRRGVVLATPLVPAPMLVVRRGASGLVVRTQLLWWVRLGRWRGCRL
eukprot:3651557-Pyramimonas_sp.AAC.1